jgi:glycerol kinase
MSVLAIDAGTTGVTAMLVAPDTSVTSRGYQEFPQHFPSSGWVEHDLEEIWQATLAAVAQCLAPVAEPPVCLGVTNQRETIALWDRTTLRATRRAIVWQDRRTAGLCEQWRHDGYGPLVRSRTGLRLDPYFSASKLTWIRVNEPQVWQGVERGETCIGTIDSYLIARMCGGRHHVTDSSNASRTMLFDIHEGQWDADLCALAGVSESALPQVVPSIGSDVLTDPDHFLGLSLPISGIAGDQQAAMFGQMCFEVGSSKCTYGTGSFVLTNTGPHVANSHAGLLSTIAWTDAGGAVTYALEGSVFVTGAAVQWLRDGLQIIDSADEVEALAESVSSSEGVVFVPALTGLGAPDWDPTARGTILGISRGTTKAHIARAALEAIAYQVRDVVDLARQDANVSLPSLAVDGGASANNLLCQLQADQINAPVVRPANLETTGVGVAFMAGLGHDVWSSHADLASARQLDRTFFPQGRDDAAHRRWRAAVDRAKGWAER